MANFATLADALAGCATRVTPIACDMLFEAAKPPKGDAPADTLTAAEAVAALPWHLPDRLFALLDYFYPVPAGKNLRPVPFMPYLNVAPSAWVLPLKFDGGGYRARRQGDVRQRGQSLGRRQLHHRLAGIRRAVARPRDEVRAERPPALADHHGFRRRRNGGRHLRRRDRRQRQRLAHQLRQQVDHRLRQDRQAADAARGHHLRRPARADAGRHRHAERRRLGPGRREEPARLLPEGRPDQGPDRLRGR